MVTKIVPAMGLDLGNGYIKLKTNDKVFVEPSVYSVVPQVDFQQGEDYTVSIGDMSFYVGNSALASNLKLMSAVGSFDALSRYTSKEYQYLLYSFLAVVYEQDVVIENLVLGLPNNHFKTCKAALTEQFTNKQYQVKYKGHAINIILENVQVLPQPMGLYFREEITDKHVMVVDLGSGTNDYTEFDRLGGISAMFSNMDGLKKYHLEVLQYLQREYPASKMQLSDVSNILKDGLKDMQNNHINVVDRYIQSLQTKYAGYILQPIIEQYDHLSYFDEVMITGGGALTFKDAILEKQAEVANIRIVEEAQMANAEGFYLFAEACAESIR
jgi:hypothetical protein